jgi:hypothetical protein
MEGTAGEHLVLGIPLDPLASYDPIERPRQAEIGNIMVGLDSRYAMAETACGLPRGWREWKLAFRVRGLQALGLTPTGMNAPVFANAARYLGATDEEIVISLLARRCIQLNSLNKFLMMKVTGETCDSESKTTVQDVRCDKVEGDSTAKLIYHVNCLSELFRRLAWLRGLVTDDHVARDYVDDILYTIMRMELSSCKRSQETTH